METITAPAKTFSGDKKHLVHCLAPFERKLLKAALPHIPPSISTVHLTMMTVVWSLAAVMAGYLSVHDLRWLWLLNAAILLQYVTDMLDGEIGRLRHQGLIKWGFYMDHFLDYVFLSSIVMAYNFLLPPSDFFLSLLCLAATGGFMVHAFMDFAVTNNFRISCNQFGVSEMRISLVIFNVAVMVYGGRLLVGVFPWFVAAAFIALCGLVYWSQKTYRHLDALQQAQQDLF